ncbi:putative hydrolase [Sulfitobacter noctilucae]|uniref:alpha/beta hydrolase n=1 Tax=Sulfitobacter noctilucae TaxID=1342302 RepID=UPI00055BEC88|nr:alpha/beta fold hydrolase [Sulfitobacter noctilucae]KIN70619.1 putative hydrolase [Sulfitobacter noctilucae]
MTNPDSVEIQFASQTIRGGRYAPVGDRQRCVLLNHGFGVTRVGVGRAFVELARELSQAGAEVFAFDRLGHGESDGRFHDVTIPGELDQISAMLDHVLQTAGTPIHVVGHSLGGMESALVAARRPGDIASLTLWAPAAVFTDDLEKGQIQGKPIDTMYETGTFDFKGQALGLGFVETGKGIDPYDGLKAYGGPVRLHQGAADEVVAMEYAEKYMEVWGKQAQLHAYPTADHGWTALADKTVLINRTLADICELAG